jgi:hypothetical protein
MSTQVELRLDADTAARLGSLKTRYRYPVHIAPAPDEVSYGRVMELCCLGMCKYYTSPDLQTGSVCIDVSTTPCRVATR